MDSDRVATLARLQGLQWAEANAAVQSDQDDQPVAGPDFVGAYRPLGSSAPRVAAGTLGTVSVNRVWARDEVLVLVLVAHADPDRLLTLEIDLADSDEADDLVASLIFARVAEVVAGPRWSELRRAGRLSLRL